MLETIGLVSGSGWAAGLNLYGVAFILGLAGRLGWADIPEVLTRTDVMVAAGVLYVVEFAADKIPYLDNVWDAIHTVVRPLGAAALGYVLAGEASSVGQAMGAMVAGALAFSSHATKATTRAAVNTSPEPVSNISLSLLEDGLAGGVTVMGMLVPLLAVIVVAALVVGGWALVRRLWRAVSKVRSRMRSGAARGGPGQG